MDLLNLQDLVNLKMKMETTEPQELEIKEFNKQLRDDFLAKISAGKNKHYLTKNAGHYVQIDEPALVLEAVNWVLLNI